MPRAIAALALIGGLLIGWAALTTPGLLAGRTWVGLAIVEHLLAVYGVVLFFVAPRTASFAIALPFGLVAAAVYAAEIAAEYALTPPDNTAFGLVEFGLVFLAFVLAGAVGAARSGRLRTGVLSAVWTAMTSALVWYAVLIGLYLAFRGSARQQLVFQAEGDLEDFRRSGGGDFTRWVVQDFFGAGFFHLLLAPVVAAVLGSVGAGVGLVVERFRPRTPPAASVRP